MKTKVLLITPPFTQLNSPYPAMTHLKGVLDQAQIPCAQVDLSLELFLRIFSREFLEKIFASKKFPKRFRFPEVFQKKEKYVSRVDLVIRFLQHPDSSTATQILKNNFLPMAHRCLQRASEMELIFGNMGIMEKARYLATLFIEELGDFIQANVDEHFGFIKYAEKISASAPAFDKLRSMIISASGPVIGELQKIIQEKIDLHQPDLIGFSIPFPGNLLAALHSAAYIKKHYPAKKIVFGGGYCSTELRYLSDPGIFSYVDFICLDQGKVPLLKIVRHLNEEIGQEELERTFIILKGKVTYVNHLTNNNLPPLTPLLEKEGKGWFVLSFAQLPAPSYQGLNPQRYISFLDTANPMHRLWSDGFWNKLIVAHGCYWQQCAFCDTSLDYICRYENASAVFLVDKIESIIQETGIYDFHFTDEAAPPRALQEMAEELIRRKLKITWWTNIRFEKTFDKKLCCLLARSGCVAVTGGLEAASDRLLKTMAKGISIAQAAKVTAAFREAGIMVHAYLMYGFPTQTVQETIDGLEIVRQLFEHDCLQSAFWHRFVATVHSQIGKDPEKFKIKIIGPDFKGFARNDLQHEDPEGADHDLFTFGLNKALYNYMLGIGLDWDVRKWFEFKVPKTTHQKNMIKKYIFR